MTRTAAEQTAYEIGRTARNSGQHLVRLGDKPWTRAEKLAAMRGFGCYQDQINAEKGKGALDEVVDF